jgi:osmoprotectant transport system permease protein
VAADLLLLGVQRLLTPWTRIRTPAGASAGAGIAKTEAV